MFAEPGSLESIRRVLVTRLRFLGDVIMTTPMLETLREVLPNASIEYLTYPQFAPVLDKNPNIDRIITMPAKASLVKTLEIVNALRRPRIDWFFDSLTNPRSAVLVALARPRHSVGLRRGARSWVYEYRRAASTADPSAVKAHLDLLVPLLGSVTERYTTLYVSRGEVDGIARRFQIEPDRELILVHPGASRPQKAWPLERWPELISAMREGADDPRIALVTQPGWEKTGLEIVRRCGESVEALPVLDLRSLFALLTLTSLYVGHDGGILHAAVALRVPSVGLLGRVDDRTWFPYTRWGPYRCLRRYDQSASKKGRTASQVERISLDDVLEAVDEVWGGGGGGP